MKPLTKLFIYTTLGLFILPTTLLAQEKTVLEGTEKEIKEEQKDLDKKKDNASGLEKAEKNANKKAGQLEKAENNLENKEEALEKAIEDLKKQYNVTVNEDYFAKKEDKINEEIKAIFWHLEKEEENRGKK